MVENTEEAKGVTNLAELFGSLISNPSAIAKIGEIIEKAAGSQSGDNSPPNSNNLSDTQGNTSNKENISASIDSHIPTFQNSESNNILSKLPSIISKLSSSKDEFSIATKEQIALLLAIRPYLSERRKELIDTFIKMNRLSNIFKNLT